MDRQKVLRNAEKLVSKGKIDAAIKQYRKVLDSSPRDTTTLNRVGDLYVRSQRIDDAMELFHRAAEHFSQEGFFVKAIAIYKKILRLDPGQLDVYEKLASLYHRQGLNTEAKNQYEVVADYHLKHEDVPSAIAVYAKIVEVVPEDATQHLRLAELYEQAGQREKALSEYREIAVLMLEDGKFGEALRVYRSALEVDSSDLDFVRAGVTRLKEVGQIAAARELMAFAIELNPEASEIHVVDDRRGSESEDDKEGEDVRIEVPETEATDVELSIAGVGGAKGHDAASAEIEILEPEVPEVESPEVVVAPETPAPAAEEATDGEAREETGEGEAVPSADDAGSEYSEEDTFEIDLGALEVEATTPDPEAEAEAPTTRPQSDAELDAELAAIAAPEAAVSADDLVARSVSVEKAPAVEDPEIDLLAEATVLASYGLFGKAIDRLEELLAGAPGRLDARERLVEILIEQGGMARAASEATELARLCFESEARDVWARLRGLLIKAGFQIERGEVLPPGGAEAPAATVGEVESEPGTARAPQGPASGEQDAGPPEAAIPVAEESAALEAEWLGAESGSGTGAGSSAADELFAEEDEFFDLAAELEEELDREGVLPAGELISDIQEQSLDDIVEGFRKGVAEALSAEDFDTHYNLGIAYREMGLLDEAIGEFQLAAKDPRYLVDCCSMLAACFVDKGFPELAIKWYERGLASPAINEEEVLGLRYELGSLYHRIGDHERAYVEYVEIYGANSNFRDIVAKLEDLRSLSNDS